MGWELGLPKDVDALLQSYANGEGEVSREEVLNDRHGVGNSLCLSLQVRILIGEIVANLSVGVRCCVVVVGRPVLQRACKDCSAAEDIDDLNGLVAGVGGPR